MTSEGLPIRKKAPRLYSIAIPDPLRPLMIHEIYQSTVYIKSRPEGIKIASPLQLAASEIDCLSKHLKNYHDSNPDNHHPRKYLSFADLQYYLYTIFNHHWDSEEHPGPMPFLRDRKLEDCSFRAGTFKHDLAPNPGQSVVPPERRENAEARLMVTINREDMSVTTQWKDMKGGDAKAEDVVLWSWLSKGAAATAAIREHDSTELLRVLPYNWDLCVYAGRKQVIEFAKAGIQPEQWPKPNIIPAQKLEFMRRHIQEMLDFWSDAARDPIALLRID